MPNTATTYLGVYGITIAMCLGLGAWINYQVDPFGVFGGQNYPHKAGMHGHDRLVKAHQLTTYQTDWLVLGTSRIQYGIDPHAVAGLLPSSLHAYNGGLLNANVYLVKRYLQHAQALHPLSHVLIGLDPLMFNANAQLPDGDFSEQRLAVDSYNHPNPWYPYADTAALLFSVDALRLSVRTLRHQSTLLSDLLANGQRNPQTLVRYYAEQGNLYDNFLYVQQTYFKDYQTADILHDSGFNQLRQIVVFCQQAQLDCRFMITPEHAQLQLVNQLAHVEPMLDAWKTKLVDTLTALAQPGKELPLWDFSSLNAYTSEPLPGKTELQWFWEATHFRPRLGTLLLQSIYGKDNPAGGVLLNHQRLQGQLYQQHVSLKRYVVENPQYLQQLAKTLITSAEKPDKSH